jgi:hypothetical protein
MNAVLRQIKSEQDDLVSSLALQAFPIGDLDKED